MGSDPRRNRAPVLVTYISGSTATEYSTDAEPSSADIVASRATEPHTVIQERVSPGASEHE